MPSAITSPSAGRRTALSVIKYGLRSARQISVPRQNMSPSNSAEQRKQGIRHRHGHEGIGSERAEYLVDSLFHPRLGDGRIYRPGRRCNRRHRATLVLGPVHTDFRSLQSSSTNGIPSYRTGHPFFCGRPAGKCIRVVSGNHKHQFRQQPPRIREIPMERCPSLLSSE